MTREEARKEMIDELEEFLVGCGVKGKEKETAESNPDFKKVYEANIMAIQALKYDDAKYHEEHGEVIIDKAILEDAKKLLEQESAYCDRNICLRNEYNGIGCDECEVTKSQEPYDFARWVASEIFDEWEYNKDSFAEIACRKLAKLGIVRAKGDEWELVEQEPTCDTCEYNTAAFNPCNACKDKSEYKPQESGHTCHTCKHYTSGERDGSCDSYICKHYSDWESEDKE